MTGFETFLAAAGRAFGRFLADQKGGVAVEYAMIAAGVGACVAGTVMALGSDLRTTFYDKLAALLQ